MKCLFVYLFINLLINVLLLFYKFNPHHNLKCLLLYLLLQWLRKYWTVLNACYCICYFSDFANIDYLKTAHFIFCKFHFASKCEAICYDIYKVIFVAEVELI